MMGKLRYLALGALALSASVAATSVAQAGTAFFWLGAYPNNSSADAAAVAAAGGTGAATGSFEYRGINFNSNGVLDYAVGSWLATGGITYGGPGAGAGLDNTLFDFTGVDFLQHDQTITVDHDDGVSLYIDGILIPGLTSTSTSEIPESVTFTGAAGFHDFSLVYGEDDGPPAVLMVTGLANIPEPSTWAMMVLGFAGLGFAAYRRSRKSEVSIVSA